MEGGKEGGEREGDMGVRVEVVKSWEEMEASSCPSTERCGERIAVEEGTTFPNHDHTLTPGRKFRPDDVAVPGATGHAQAHGVDLEKNLGKTMLVTSGASGQRGAGFYVSVCAAGVVGGGGPRAVGGGGRRPGVPPVPDGRRPREPREVDADSSASCVTARSRTR